MSSPAAIARERARVPVALLVVSSLLVLLVAVGFDIAADEPPVHTLAVALAVAVVGVGRLCRPGRFGGVFVTVNLAIIGQPAVHALGKLPQAGAELMPHSHGWPQGLSGVALHVVVALLVVAVAVLEPTYAFVVTRLLPALRQLTQTPPADGPVREVHRARTPAPRPRAQRLLFARQAHRRGPPVLALLAA